MSAFRPERLGWKPFLARAVVLLALAGGAGCAHLSEPAARSDALTQVSVIDGLLVGEYSGAAACGELGRWGDFGLGTFEALDGEMVMLEGVVYAVRGDGRVEAVRPEERTPFAAITFFDADRTFPLELLDYPDVLDRLTQALPSENHVHAIWIQGAFDRVKTRSVPRQSPPYPPLAKAVEGQAVFEFEKVEGDLIGFWIPPFGRGINATGWHFHFLSADRAGGGHVLEARLRKGVVRMDHIADWNIRLSGAPAFLGADFTPDRSAELHRAETDPWPAVPVETK
ncbi:MAG: acetolactate decarboxylase [Kiritimatiellae bacterium]|nr:acetolactate decarboxylase [Kiritimatiellia bacterium]